jgi:DNA-binding Lrp family transcriptional regulator
MAIESDLDAFDREILRRVQLDARATGEDIGATIGLSAAAVQRRLKRLRDLGVIVADVAVVDPLAVGQAMTFIVGVELERERADMLDAFRRAARADPNVQQCYYVTGAADFMLVVIARDMDDFEAFTRRLLFDNPNIRRFTTNVVMARDKVGLGIPV